MAKNKETIKQWNDLKAKYPDTIFLFRCGDFYETYHDDARVCAKILGITLTFHGEDKKPMAGFPHHALDKYLPMLIRKGKRVAICDLLEDPRQVKNNNNQKTSTTMKETFKAADLIGKTIVVGDNQATIVIKSVDGDKLSGEFTKDGKTTPMSFPVSQLHGMTEKGLWKLTDSTEATDVTTEADVQEVQDIVPVVTPREKTHPQPLPVSEVSEKPTAKVEPIGNKAEPKPKAKSVVGSTYRVELLPTKDGQKWPKLYGFKDESEAKKTAGKMAKTVTYSWDRDEQGEKRYYLKGGKKYCEVFQQLADALNIGEKTVIDKVCKASVAIFEGARAEGKKKSDCNATLRPKVREGRDKTEDVHQPSAISHQPSAEKTYTQTELAEWLRKLNSGTDKEKAAAAKFFNDLAKAA